jgi:hypothetical protein
MVDVVGSLIGLGRRNRSGRSTTRSNLHTCCNPWIVRSILMWFRRWAVSGAHATTWSLGHSNILWYSLSWGEMLRTDWLSRIVVGEVASFNVRWQLMRHVILMHWNWSYPLRNHRWMRLYVWTMHSTIIIDILHLLILINRLPIGMLRLRLHSNRVLMLILRLKSFVHWLRLHRWLHHVSYSFILYYARGIRKRLRIDITLMTCIHMT